MKKWNIPVGISEFEKIRKNGYYYLDKSGLIAELLKTESTEVDGMSALRIPNAEIKEIFETTVMKWFHDNAKNWNRKPCIRLMSGCMQKNTKMTMMKFSVMEFRFSKNAVL